MVAGYGDTYMDFRIYVCVRIYVYTHRYTCRDGWMDGWMDGWICVLLLSEL